MWCAQNQRGGRFHDLDDVTPVCNPCEGIGYKAPFRKEIPFKMTFIVQWYVEQLELEKRFLLLYYDYDGTIELQDIDRHRIFLKRTKLETVKANELFLGNKLLVLSRHLIILDYCDKETREYCEPKGERAFLLVRPEAMNNLPCIIQRVEKCFRILRAKLFTITQALAYEMNEEYVGQEIFLNAVNNLTGKPAAAIFVMAENALEKMRNLVGVDIDPNEAVISNPKSLRALYGVDKVRRGFFYTESKESTLKHAAKYFADCPCCVIPSSVLMNNQTTCCVIKPHVMREGRAGMILGEIIGNGFSIEALGVFWLNKRQAEEFYEIYSRIYAEAEFMAMIDELAVGPCMVVELSCPNQNPSDATTNTTVCSFRSLCGPGDSDLARKVRPTTIRAHHGLTKIQNAVHCTDLPENAYYELEYFFKVLEHNPNFRSVTGIVPGGGGGSSCSSCNS